MDPQTEPNSAFPTGIRIYALGSNGSGQLSLLHCEDVSTPTLCTFSLSCQEAVPMLSNEEDWTVKKIVAGGNHTVILFDNGIVCVGGKGPGAGENPSSSTEEKDLGLFRIIQLPPDTQRSGPRICTDVAATWEATIMIVHNGTETRNGTQIYVLGVGLKGELGLGEAVSSVTFPTELSSSFLPEKTSICCVAACMSHVVIVLSDGSCWGWGTSRKGELGDAAAAKGKVQWSPRRINEAEKVKHAVCGNGFTILVPDGEDGSESTFLGSNKWLQGEHLHDLKSHAIQPDLTTYASWGSIYCLNPYAANGLRSWGRNDRGQLPTKTMPAIAKFAVGSEHVVALTRGKEVISWGWGEHGNCGIDPDSGLTSDIVAGRWNTIRADLEEGWRIVDVGAGCATSFLVAARTSG